MTAERPTDVDGRAEVLGPFVAIWPKRQSSKGSGLPWAFPASVAAVRLGVHPDAHPTLPLAEAFQRRHDGDVWFQAVTWPGRSRWPRLAKAILREPAGVEPVLTSAVLDLDRPDHRADPWGSAAEADAAMLGTLHKLDEAGWPNAWGYATRGGLRVGWVLEHPVPLRHAQSFLDGLHAALPAGLPVQVDQGVRDWTRGFRLPWVRRADAKAPAWRDDAPPMRIDALTEGRALAWRPAELVDETVHEHRDVSWWETPPAETPADRRIRPLVEKWAREISASTSRHAELRDKCIALGGLCRGARDLGIDCSPPEHWLPAMVDAAGDSNDAQRTARWSVDAGAERPWWFEERPPPGHRAGGWGWGEANAEADVDQGESVNDKGDPAQEPIDRPARAVERLRALVEAGPAGRSDALAAMLGDPDALRGYLHPGALGGEVERLRSLLPSGHRTSLDRAARAVEKAARAAERAGARRSDDATDAARERVRDTISYETRGGEVKVRTTLGTAREVLLHDPEWQDRIRLNELTGCVEVDGVELQDLDVLRVAVTMERHYAAEWKVETVRNALQVVASARPHHPIREYLAGLPAWDGRPRLDRLLSDYFGVSTSAGQKDLHAAYGRNFIVGMVARGIRPGVKLDDVLVLYGPQGIRKSTGLRALMPDPQLFYDGELPIDDPKRFIMIVRRYWLIELAELASVRKSTADSVKAMVTRTTDEGVPMHGRATVHHKRTAVFAGTVNDQRFLTEAGRRWCVVTVGRQIDTEAIERDRDQIWAEGLHRFNAREQWHLPPDLQIKQAAAVHEHVLTDPAVDIIRDWVSNKPANWLVPAEGYELVRLWHDIMEPIVTGGDPKRIAPFGMAEQKAFAKHLRDAGWLNRPTGRTRCKRWFPPDWNP